MVKLGDVNPTIWDVVTSQMEDALKDIEFQADDLEIDWKRLANSRKLEREVFAKYGYFKDIILHPTFQSTKQWLVENVYFDLLLGDPLMPVATAVILLYMLHKRVNNHALSLIGAFMFNVNPLYVVLSSLAWWWMTANRKPKQFKKVPKKYRLVNKSNTKNEPIDSTLLDEKDLSFDHILIGNNISTIYAAAVLSKVGHRCLVLEPLGSPSTEFYPADSPCPVPIHNLTVGKVDRYKNLLEMVQVTKDPTKKINFAPLGKADNGFAHTVCRIVRNLHDPKQKMSHAAAFHPGEGSSVESLTSISAVDSKLLKLFVDTLASAQQSITSYMITKISNFGDDSKLDPLLKSKEVKQFMDLAGNNIAEVLDRSVQDPYLHAALNGLSVIGSDEAIAPEDCSGYGLAHFLATSEQGLYYPKGGLQRLKSNLIETIQSAGGKVYSNVPIREISISEDGKATGVIVQSNTGDGGRDISLEAEKSVISCTGVLNTFTRLVPHKHVSTEIRTALSTLTEARPKCRVVYWLRGTAEGLGLASTEYYEVSGEYPSVQRIFNQAKAADGSSWLATAGESPKVSKDSYINNYCKITCPSVQDADWVHRHPDLQVVVVEVELVDSLASLAPFVFTEAPAVSVVDTTSPSTSTDIANVVPASTKGPMMYKCTSKDLLTSSNIQPIDNASSSLCGEAIVLKKSQSNKLKAFTAAKLKEVYPLIFEDEDKNIVHVGVANGVIGGFQLSSTAGKFNSKLGSCTDIAGLYLGGKDISSSGLAGEIQGGWIAANAVLGYTVNDLIISRNITSDLS